MYLRAAVGCRLSAFVTGLKMPWPGPACMIRSRDLGRAVWRSWGKDERNQPKFIRQRPTLSPIYSRWPMYKEINNHANLQLEQTFRSPLSLGMRYEVEDKSLHESGLCANCLKSNPSIPCQARYIGPNTHRQHMLTVEYAFEASIIANKTLKIEQGDISCVECIGSLKRHLSV